MSNNVKYLSYAGLAYYTDKLRGNFLSNKGINYVNCGANADGEPSNEFTIVHNDNEYTYLMMHRTGITLSSVDDPGHSHSKLILDTLADESMQRAVLEVGNQKITLTEESGIDINLTNYDEESIAGIKISSVSDDDEYDSYSKIILNASSYSYSDNTNRTELAILPDKVTINGEKILTEHKQYRLEYAAIESLQYIQPCNINYTKHEYDDETGEGVFIYTEAPTSIINGAFDGCTSLTRITIPNSVTTIESWAFYGCTSLTGITIPDSVVTIESNAFSSCDALNRVIIGKRVTSITDNAFSSCTSLKTVYCKAKTPPVTSDVFPMFASNIKIYVPINSLDAYKSATSWADYADNITGSEILSLPDDSLMSIAISLDERIKHLENIIEQITITK